MSSVIIAGNTSGSITLSAPAISGSSVLTLPVATDTLVGKATTDTLTNKTLTAPAISSAVMTTMASSVLTSATAQASTSGTSIDFTGIPSWVKRITVMLNGVSTSGTSSIILRIGSGSILATGYVSICSYISSGVGTESSTTEFRLIHSAASLSASEIVGSVTLSLQTSATNIWCENGVLGKVAASTSTFTNAGTVALSGTLDRVRITTVNGTDTFDAGSINLLYE
jgi:hypothetical protein